MGAGNAHYLLHSQTIPRPPRERDKVHFHLRRHVRQPTLGDELLRPREDARVAVLEVSRHADGDTGRDSPLLETEGLIRGDTRAAVHGAVAETIHFPDVNQSMLLI